SSPFLDLSLQVSIRSHQFIPSLAQRVLSFLPRQKFALLVFECGSQLLSTLLNLLDLLVELANQAQVVSLKQDLLFFYRRGHGDDTPSLVLLNYLAKDRQEAFGLRWLDDET